MARVIAGYTPAVRILGRLVTTLSRLAAFGAGYVLGARAGRERYERLRSVVRQATKEPQVHPRPTRVEEPVGVHRLLTDEHVDTQDQLVYSTGPDIEGSVGELSPIGDDDRL